MVIYGKVKTVYFTQNYSIFELIIFIKLKLMDQKERNTYNCRNIWLVDLYK